MPDSLEAQIKKAAYEIGFSHVGIAAVSQHTLSNNIFEKWLDEGKHGEMSFLSRWRERRRDPGVLLEDAKSAICVAVNYYTESLGRNREIDGSDGRGIFSIYAHGRDYHNVLGEMLSTLDVRLKSYFPQVKTIACVDTKPVSDRTFAIRSGIAWLGKNTNVISPRYGSWIFLGELITDLELEPDSLVESQCGSCTICIESCPTGALSDEYILDARRCISYLTIGKRGDIPKEFHEPIGLSVYGCDECQRVCPFNSVAVESSIFRCEERNPLVDMQLRDLACIDDILYEELTRDSAISLCNAESMRRNILIVQENIAARNVTPEEGKW